MKAVSIRTVAVAVSIFLAGYNLCIAAEAPARQILTSFVSCEVSNIALEKAGISDKTLQDANSDSIIATKVFSLLQDQNSAKLLANPKLLTIDGEAGRVELANESVKVYKIDLAASITKDSLIDAKINWQRLNPQSPGVESVKTQLHLHSGRASVVGSHRLDDHTLFLIVTSEILDPNKPKANAMPQSPQEKSSNERGQQILKKMANVNSYWLVRPPKEVKTYSYDLNLHVWWPNSKTQQKFTVNNADESNKAVLQGVTYYSVLHEMAIDPCIATIINIVKETEEAIRLDFTLKKPVTIVCGNGVSDTSNGKFSYQVNHGSFWIDIQKYTPITLKAGEEEEHFSNYTRIGDEQWIPLVINVHKYNVSADNTDRSMHFDFKFGVFEPGLWLFAQSRYRLGKIELPLVDEPLAASISSITINGIAIKHKGWDEQARALAEQSQSAAYLHYLGEVLNNYIDSNNEKYPDNLSDITKYANPFILPWVFENVEYLGKQKSATKSPKMVIAYDKRMIELGSSTNVLFSDTHVEFCNFTGINPDPNSLPARQKK
jgi:hypothetical protein